MHLASVRKTAYKICEAQQKLVEQKNVDKATLLATMMKEAVLEKGKTVGTGSITVDFGDLKNGIVCSNGEGKSTFFRVFSGYNKISLENSLKEWSQSMGYTARFGSTDFAGYHTPTLTLTPIA